MVKPPRMSVGVAGAGVLTVGIIALAVGLFSGHGESSQPLAPMPVTAVAPSGSASITGIVTDARTGVVVPSSVVAIQGKSAVTAADGRYVIADLTGGQAWLTVRHQGHRNFTQGLTLVGTTVVDVVMTAALEAGAAGDWTGRWTNETLGSTGAMVMTLSVDTMAQTIQATLRIESPAFGRGGPRTETISGPYTTAGATLAKEGSPAFGDLRVHVSPVGHITGSAVNVPAASVSRLDFTGSIAASAMEVEYTVTSATGSVATGVAALQKQ